MKELLSPLLHLLNHNPMVVGILIGITLGVLDIYLVRILISRRIRKHTQREASVKSEEQPLTAIEKSVAEEGENMTPIPTIEQIQTLITNTEPSNQAQEQSGVKPSPHIPESLKKAIKKVKIPPPTKSILNSQESVKEELEERIENNEMLIENKIVDREVRREKGERIAKLQSKHSTAQADIRSLLEALKEVDSEVKMLRDRLKNMGK